MKCIFLATYHLHLGLYRIFDISAFERARLMFMRRFFMILLRITTSMKMIIGTMRNAHFGVTKLLNSPEM